MVGGRRMEVRDQIKHMLKFLSERFDQEYFVVEGGNGCYRWIGKNGGTICEGSPDKVKLEIEHYVNEVVEETLDDVRDTVISVRQKLGEYLGNRGPGDCVQIPYFEFVKAMNQLADATHDLDKVL
jgi:hypothetical protein